MENLSRQSTLLLFQHCHVLLLELEFVKYDLRSHGW